MGEVRQLPAPPSLPPASPPPLRRAQNACYEALSLALKEGHVFAALTGPEGSGKTTVLDAVLADRRDRALRCIRISDPDKVPASLAEQIEQVAYAEAGKPENLERHVVLAVDDAHTASPELLLCLARLAAMREPGRRVPQVLLVGRSELWQRLEEADCEPLARRLAIRAALPAVEEDTDPWASVETEVTQTMSLIRAEADLAPALREPTQTGPDRAAPFGPPFGSTPGQISSGANREFLDEPDVPPPSVFALFPDPPPAARRPKRDSRRLMMPLVGLFVGVAGFAFVLSFYDWPDLVGAMPWSEPTKQASTPFVMPRLPQTPSNGVPLPPVASPKPAPVQAPAAPTAARPPARTEPIVQATPAPPEPASPAPTQIPPKPEIATAPVTAPPPVAAPAPPAVSAPPPTQNAAAAPAAPPLLPPAAPVLAPAAPTTASAAASVAPVRAKAPEETLSPALVALLLRRGDEQSGLGDISAARLLYERAAESGSGLAARQLARTYDPAFLPPAVEGALSNLAQARIWYQRAATLGNAEAAARLKALDQGR